MDEALRQVLAGSGLEAVAQGETLVVRQRPTPPGQEAIPLPEVVVQDNRAKGVAVEEASSALKLGVPLMETPQSVSVIPALQARRAGRQSVLPRRSVTRRAFRQSPSARKSAERGFASVVSIRPRMRSSRTG